MIGSKLKITFMYRFTISYFPNASPFLLFNNDDKVDRVVATDE